MSSLNVLVYDDQPEVAERFANEITEACNDADVTPAGGKNFQELIDLLNRRRTSWRDGVNEVESTESHVADKADVIVVDYDLLGYSRTATGSVLAYLLRCFSRCGFIIILNEYGSNVFDLRLGSPTADFADIHIGDAQIGNAGLWQATIEGYRPWYWPVIPDATKNFMKCVEDVHDNLDMPILEFLGLNDVVDWIPGRARDFLTGEKRVEEVTFRNFVESSQGGIDIKDVLVPDQTARVAAARIITLLNSIILPEQNVLVDAPHLISRFPSLIQENRADMDLWNMLCNPSVRDEDELLSEGLKTHKFQKPHWLWRPAWYWPKINRDEEIEEVKDPWSVNEVDWVFCENISQFVPMDLAQDFRSLVSPPFIKRFVLRDVTDGAKRYVSQLGDQGRLDPSIVDYVPQAAFSL